MPDRTEPRRLPQSIATDVFAAEFDLGRGFAIRADRVAVVRGGKVSALIERFDPDGRWTVSTPSGPGGEPALRRVGSWQEALDAAGEIAEIVEDLRRRYAEIGDIELGLRSWSRSGRTLPSPAVDPVDIPQTGQT